MDSQVRPSGPGRRGEQLELVAVHGPPPGEHRFLHVGADASGVPDGAGTAAGAAGVGEGAADGVPAVGVVAGVGIRVRFPPAARVWQSGLSQECANTGTVSRASTPYSRA